MGNGQYHDARVALEREYGSELSLAVEKLAKCCEQVHHKISVHHDRSCLPGTSARETHRPFFVNLAIIFEEVGKKRETPITSGRAFRNVDEMKFVKEMVKHATAAYMDTKHDIALLLNDIGEDDIKHTYTPVMSRCPRFYIAHDPHKKALMVGIRGERSGMEAMDHCIAPKIPYCGGYANQDLLEKSQLLLDAVAPTVRQLFSLGKYPGGLIFTGHGPGGGVAILAALALLALESPIAQTLGVKHTDVWCVAFGAPPVFAPTAIIPQRINEHIISVVHDMDIIPRLCLGTVAKLLLAIRKVDEHPLTLFERDLDQKYDGMHGLEMHDSKNRLDIKEAVPLPDDMDNDFWSLYHVGTLIGIFSHKGKWKVHRLEPENLDQILLHRHMMKDHSIEAYDDALASSYDEVFDPKVVEVEARPSMCC